MHRRDRKRSRRQKEFRRRCGERAFIFDAGLSRCLGAVDREEWEFAISVCGGEAHQAALLCRIEGAARGARALWGVNPQAALDAYRHWQRGKARGSR